PISSSSTEAAARSAGLVWSWRRWGSPISRSWGWPNAKRRSSFRMAALRSSCRAALRRSSCSSKSETKRIVSRSRIIASGGDEPSHVPSWTRYQGSVRTAGASCSGSSGASRGFSARRNPRSPRAKESDRSWLGFSRRHWMEPRPSRSDLLRSRLDDYLQHLALERRLSPRTVDAYRSDLERHLDALVQEGIGAPEDLTPEHLREYLATLHDAGMSPRTRMRARASLRGFYGFLFQERVLTSNLAAELEAPRIGRDLPHVLPPEDVERLLSAIAGEEAADLRDRAMLELAYGSGLRASELVTIGVEDLDLRELW